MTPDWLPSLGASLVAASIITLIAILATRPFRNQAYSALKSLFGLKLTMEELVIRAQLKESIGEFRLAIDDVAQALGEKPNDLRSLNLMGSLLIEIEDYEQAANVLKKALEVNPMSAEVHNNLGVVYHDVALKENNDFDLALAEFRKAADLKPEFAEALANLGDIYYHNDQFREALANLSRAVEIDPSLVRAQSRLGMVYSDTGNLAKALNHFELALKLRKNYPPALNNRAETFLLRGDYQKALRDLERLKETERPIHPATFTNLGKAHRLLGNYDEALENLDKSIDIQPDHLKPRANRAMALFAMKRFEAAEMELELSLQLDRGMAWDNYHISAMMSVFGKPEKALERLETGIRLNDGFKAFARTDPDFDNIRPAEHFIQLVNGASEETNHPLSP